MSIVVNRTCQNVWLLKITVPLILNLLPCSLLTNHDPCLGKARHPLVDQPEGCDQDHGQTSTW